MLTQEEIMGIGKLILRDLVESNRNVITLEVQDFIRDLAIYFRKANPKVDVGAFIDVCQFHCEGD